MTEHLRTVWYIISTGMYRFPTFVPSSYQRVAFKPMTKRNKRYSFPLKNTVLTTLFIRINPANFRYCETER
jgi:hypothetical protein